VKSALIIICVLLFTSSQAPDVLANDVQYSRTMAQKYYLQGDYKKAYRRYFKLAKSGDSQSQHKVSLMIANGEGTKTNLEEAYAWSTLAVEGGHEGAISTRHDLLQQIEDQEEAERKATKLKKKYGQQALREKADKIAKHRSRGKSHNCTGSRLGC